MPRRVLGYPARTQRAGRDASNVDTGDRLFPISFREMATIPGVSPPMNYHSLIQEPGRDIVHYTEVLTHTGASPRAHRSSRPGLLHRS